MSSILLRYSTILVLSLLVVLCPQVLLAEEQSQTKEEAQSPEVEAEQEEENKEIDAWELFVFGSEKYYFKHSSKDDEQDHDLNLSLDIGMIDPTDHYAVNLSLGIHWDLNGIDKRGTQSSFRSINDPDNPPVRFDVYSLYGEYHDSGILNLIRGGRQVSEYGKLATFDGATLVLKPVRKYFDIFLFGGRKVNFFEVDASFFEDWIASGGFVIRPVESLKFILDYRFSYEDTLTKDDIMNHSGGFTGYYRYDDLVYIKAYLRSIDKSIAETGGSVMIESTEYSLGSKLEVMAQPSELGEINETNDPYFSVTGTSSPHVKYAADFWKDFQTTVGLYSFHLGYEGRNLIRGNSETQFNRNSGRAYVLLNGYDIGIEGLFLTLNFERWADDLSFDSEGLLTVGGSAGYDMKIFRGELGSSYLMYKYDYYLDVNESANVRTFWVDLKGKPLDWLTIKARYELELYDRTVHKVMVGLSQVY